MHFIVFEVFEYLIPADGAAIYCVRRCHLITNRFDFNAPNPQPQAPPVKKQNKGL